MKEESFMPIPNLPGNVAGAATIHLTVGTRTNTVRVPAGESLEVLLQTQGVDPAANATRVNGQAASGDRPLADGDRVSVTPSKVAGARRAA